MVEGEKKKGGNHNIVKMLTVAIVAKLAQRGMESGIVSWATRKYWHLENLNTPPPPPPRTPICMYVSTVLAYKHMEI